MFLATSNKAKRLLHLSYIQHIKSEELKRGLEDMKTLLVDLPPGFLLLADFGRLESMDPDCATEIGRIMELLDQSGVGMVVRVISDSNKDIGLNIMTLFHYHHHLQVVTCKNMVEAAKKF
jgi:ABC-type lipopolysaccharide export system ATPase subunit